MQNSIRLLFVFALFGFCPTPADASPWRGVIAREKSGGLEMIMETGVRYPVLGAPISPELIGRELLAHGRLATDPLAKPAPLESLFVTRAEPAPTPEAPVFAPIPSGHYARTERTIPEESLHPGQTIMLELPELGKSASSDGKEPIQAMILLPENYRRETAHPVVIHMGGGRGGTGGAHTWRRVVGWNNFILVGADYDHKENLARGMLDIGTCRDFDSKIALHVLQILANSTGIDTKTVILSGTSSGAYSITDNLASRPRAWQPFAGFCVLAGGAETGSPRLGHRSVLFIMGDKDTPNRLGWLQEGVDQLRRVRGNRVAVHILPGVEHNWDESVWNNMVAPLIRDWLASDFPALAAVHRRRALLKSAPSPEVRAVVAEWIRRSGLE